MKGLLPKKDIELLRRIFTEPEKLNLPPNILEDVNYIKDTVTDTKFLKASPETKVETLNMLLDECRDYFPDTNKSTITEDLYEPRIEYICDGRGEPFLQKDITTSSQKYRHASNASEFLNQLVSGNITNENLLIGPDGFQTFVTRYNSFFYVYTKINNSFVMWGSWPESEGYSTFNKRQNNQTCVEQLHFYRESLQENSSHHITLVRKKSNKPNKNKENQNSET